MPRIITISLLLLFLHATPCRAQELRDEAAAAMLKAATYYREKVARHGGYVYYVDADLKQRWGEGAVTEGTILVQPPGTPTVGMAYLKAHAATGDLYYLVAASKAADAMVRGQLESGGWTQTIHFGPAKRLGKYRKGNGGEWNASSLDDNQTQSALVFLMHVDVALKAQGFQDAAIHEAVKYGLAALLKAQFANGAFPQVWTGPVSEQKVKPAKLPDYDWKTENRVKNYWDFYTLNDGLSGTVCETLIVAHTIYKDAKYLAALEKLGDFLILAQMPAPQRGWCQQYGYEMTPIWARKFEPPAITGSESQDAMRTLIRIARHTGKAKYLEPLPDALAYFRKSLLPDGKLARFYELGTNKPLYMNTKYELSYSDADVPTHYSWKVSSKLSEIESAYNDAKAGKPLTPRVATAKEMEGRVKRIIAELDSESRWVSTRGSERLTGQPALPKDFKYLSSAVFAENIETISAYLMAK